MECTKQHLEIYLTGLIRFKKENNDSINNDTQAEEGQAQSLGKKNECIVDGNPNVYRITNRFEIMTQHWQHYHQWVTLIYRYLSRYADTFVAINGIEQIFDKKSGEKRNGKQKYGEDINVEEKADENQPSHAGHMPGKWEHQTCLKYLLHSILNYVRIELSFN